MPAQTMWSVSTGALGVYEWTLPERAKLCRVSSLTMTASCVLVLSSNRTWAGEGRRIAAARQQSLQRMDCVTHLLGIFFCAVGIRNLFLPAHGCYCCCCCCRSSCCDSRATPGCWATKGMIAERIGACRYLQTMTAGGYWTHWTALTAAAIAGDMAQPLLCVLTCNQTWRPRPPNHHLVLADQAQPGSGIGVLPEL